MDRGIKNVLQTGCHDGSALPLRGYSVRCRSNPHILNQREVFPVWFCRTFLFTFSFHSLTLNQMANWKINQEVVCVRSCENRLVIKGRKYIIESIVECSCGVVMLELVGINHLGYIGTMCDCGQTYDGIALKKSNRFRPLLYTSVGISKELAKEYIQIKEVVEPVKTKEHENH